jgi:hypothetical protein
MLLAVKTRFGRILFLLFPCMVSGQSRGRVRIGLCSDADRFEAARAAGFDSVRINASKVVVLGRGGARRVPEGFSREEAFNHLVDFCRRRGRSPCCGRLWLAGSAGRNG